VGPARLNGNYPGNAMANLKLVEINSEKDNGFIVYVTSFTEGRILCGTVVYFISTYCLGT
jgi:hypothetical protein